VLAKRTPYVEWVLVNAAGVVTGHLSLTYFQYVHAHMTTTGGAAT